MSPQQSVVRTPLALAFLLVLIALSDVVSAKFVYVIGDEKYPWEKARNKPSAELRGADVLTQPGWLAPRRVDGEDLVLTAATEGGSLCQTWVIYEKIESECTPVKGGVRVFYEEWPPLWNFFYQAYMWFPLRTQMVYLDLGGQFGVNRIQIEPIPEEDLESYLKRRRETKLEYITRHPLVWMEVGVNDGEPGTTDVYGRPVSEPVWGEKVRTELKADMSFPVRPVRYVGLQALARWPPFHIGAMHVYGEGFVPKTVYRSPILVLGGKLNNVGQIRWKGEKEGDAQIRIRTRTGMDSDPNVYWRKTEEGELSRLDAGGRPLTRGTYMTLPGSERGGITYDGDHENWSSWSAAYPFEEGLEGVEVVSPSPCLYIQIKVEMEGRYDEDRRLDHIAFEYSRPVLAHQILGEIAPTQVQPSERTTFHYAITPMMEVGDRGFDTVEIFTPSPVDTVRSVQWDGVEVPIVAEVLDDPPGLVVHVPQVKRSSLRVDVHFDATVYRYGTTFRARVFDGTVDEVPQWVTPGDASPIIESGTLSVQTNLEEPLLTSVTVHPNPFSPNGDGFNDETWISYDVLQLTQGAPVRVQILDLLGCLVRTVYAGSDPSGPYRRRWDGRDDGGTLVPPGLYLVRVSVEADAATESLVRTLAVVY